MVVEGARSNLNAEIAFGLEQGERGLRLASLSRVGLVGSLTATGPAPREPDQGDTKLVAAAQPPKAPDPRTGSIRLGAANDASEARPVEPSPACAGTARRYGEPVRADDLRERQSLVTRSAAGFALPPVWREADEKKRAALLRTRRRFNERRDARGSFNCLTTAYVSRLREISDIMAGRASI